MPRSMTAFALCESHGAYGVLRFELRAVNHRYLDLSLKMPEDLRSAEPLVRARVAERVQRGKLDLGLRFRPAQASGNMHINESLLSALMSTLGQWHSKYPQLAAADPVALLGFPGVLEAAEFDQSELQQAILALLERVLDEFDAGREREGSQLAKVMLERAEQITELRSQALELMPAIREGQRQKMQQRLGDLKQPVEPGRLEQELTLWLQKLDVEEELDRLAVHLKELKRVLGAREPAGRRLDFLLQELNREANTFGSKSVDARTSQLAIEFKVLIDQIREQALNLE
jgi:uncharacterized protein (TIGR00255 family)